MSAANASGFVQTALSAVTRRGHVIFRVAPSRAGSLPIESYRYPLPTAAAPPDGSGKQICGYTSKAAQSVFEASLAKDAPRRPRLTAAKAEKNENPAPSLFVDGDLSVGSSGTAALTPAHSI